MKPIKLKDNATVLPCFVLWLGGGSTGCHGREAVNSTMKDSWRIEGCFR
jgi:hypothetical protein